MTQEFHVSVTSLGDREYLVRTEQVEPGVPLAEEQVVWPVEAWLERASYLMDDPLLGVLRGYGTNRIGGADSAQNLDNASTWQPDASPLTLVELGQQLYNALFQGTLRDSWMTAQGIAQHRTEVLRLRLGLKGLPLHRLPWEVLQSGGDAAGSRQRHGVRMALRPLATGTDLVFSRYQPGITLLGADASLAIASDQPLRILMAIAAPSDQERLELKQEVLHLQQELTHHQISSADQGVGQLPEIQLTILDQPGREQLTQALEQGHYQVFHYAGHSNLGAAGGDLYLVNPKTGLTETLNGDDLAGLLVNNGVRLAVFNSCRGAYTATADTVPGGMERNLAEALISQGVPAVLAMAEKIPDAVALSLTRLFYRNVKRGYPIDLSLSRARQGLISAYGSDQLYWALPILYMHPEFDGYLTTNDRQYGNPADRLVLPPKVFQEPLTLAGEAIDSLKDGEPVPSLDTDDELEMLTRAVLEDDDLGDLTDHFGDDLDLGDAFTLVDDPAPDEDAALVAELIQQLKSPDTPSDTSWTVAPANENLLPDAQHMDVDEIYRQLPEHPDYSLTKSPERSPQVSAEEAIEAIAQLDAPAISSREVVPPVVAVHSSDSPTVLETASRRRTAQKRWLPWAALGTTVGGIAIALVFGLLLPRLSGQSGTTPNLPEVPNVSLDAPSDDHLATEDTSTLTAIALSQLGQNNLAAAQPVITELLNRGAMEAARTALDAVPSEYAGDPAISFLRGRLAWESFKRGNHDYSIDDVRRYWETATQGQPDSVPYHNALGFAYYQEGRSRDAFRTWCQTLSLIDTQQRAELDTASRDSGSDCPLPEQLTGNTDALMAAAGMALALQQDAITAQELGAPDSLISKAKKFQNMVIANDPINFAASALAQNWLWTESTIQEWRNLGNL